MVLRLNLRSDELGESKKVKYRKDRRVGEARGGWFLGRLMEN